MKILVLGGAGYIGSVLCPYLMERGHEVIIFDNMLYEGQEPSLPCKFVKADTRNLNQLWPAINSVDSVVHLAGLSNDPASDLDPKLTWDINHKANKNIADICKVAKKKVVFASSCSVYGFSNDGTFDEESQLGPVTLYAKTKMLSEQFFLDPALDAVILRFATVYGHSPKSRFDLVVNTMVGTSFFEKKITVNGGEQWRPLVHVKDVAQAVHLALESKTHKNRIFNVGSNRQNYRIKDLAYLIKNEVPEVDLVVNDSSIDKRSYKVDFSRIEKELGFAAKYNIATAIKELYEAFENKSIQSMAEDVYYRVKYLQNHYFYFPNWQPKWGPLKALKLKLHRLRV